MLNSDPTATLDDVLAAVREQRGILMLVERRLKHLEADVALIRAAYASHSKVIGDMLRATPIPEDTDR